MMIHYILKNTQLNKKYNQLGKEQQLQPCYQKKISFNTIIVLITS